MVTVVFDGTFEGWLTAVFEVYEYKWPSVTITTKEHLQPNVFTAPHQCFYDVQKATRVWKGLSAKISAAALSQLYKSFLCEEKGIEDVMLQYAQYAFKSKQSIECDYSHPAVLAVIRASKKVHREKHRIEAFIRFQLTTDSLYYAVCQPDSNVLPIIEKHFKNRYADQKWLIYDSKRKYGIYYDLNTVETVNLTFNEATNEGKNLQVILDETELLYQQLWQQYFSSINIAARKNTKLHIQHMPRRYWKYLPEKQPK
jgi:probable DNA metabolism protein